MNIPENRQQGAQGPQAIKPVRYTRQIISKVHAIAGGALFGAGAIVLALSFIFTNNAAQLSLMITGGTLTLSGTVELIIAAVFRKLVSRERGKLERLKAEGRSFPAEIVKVQLHLGVRIGRSVSAYADCSYQTQEGKTCLVRSRSFLCDTHGLWGGSSQLCENYSAWVYVNPYDPTDYAVEIFAKIVDYDYR